MLLSSFGFFLSMFIHANRHSHLPPSSHDGMIKPCRVIETERDPVPPLQTAGKVVVLLGDEDLVLVPQNGDIFLS